jgi:hypothetical protein
LATVGLLALIDDIATLLDDVAALSKIATQKTAGVLGDDLALNAEQVSGVKAERELPVVWAVAKGSIKNKFILVPGALLISAIAPWAIPILLILGGTFLCFEGAEKVFHKLFHSKYDKDSQEVHQEKLQALSDHSVDIIEFEKQKIKGAIRTDFILSAEIIVIILGIVQGSNFITQITVVSGMALAVTIFIYGVVAGIVKIDDAGLYLSKVKITGIWSKFKRSFGIFLLLSAPYLMKTLSIVGTIAMFLVGGGILIHNIPFIHHITISISDRLPISENFPFMVTLLSDALTGIILGIITLSVVKIFKKLLHRGK